MNFKIEENLNSVMNYFALTYQEMSKIKIDTYDLNLINEEVKKLSNFVTFFDDEYEEVKKIYIPILRSLRAINCDVDDAKDILADITRSDYTISKDIEVITGQDINKDMLSLTQKRLLEYEQFLNDNFFDEHKIKLIPQQSKPINIVFGNEKMRNIFNVGDGIQAIIALTFPLFMHKDENLRVFIEEPELNLHPGLQRKFLKVISHDRFSKLQFFITTQSNHFIDMTFDYSKISIFKFSKKYLSNADPIFLNCQYKSDK